jgi:hypothetical protein
MIGVPTITQTRANAVQITPIQIAICDRIVFMIYQSSFRFMRMQETENRFFRNIYLVGFVVV